MAIIRQKSEQQQRTEGRWIVAGVFAAIVAVVVMKVLGVELAL